MSEAEAAMIRAVDGAHQHPATVDREAAQKLLGGVQAQLFEKYGDDLRMMQHPDAPGVDRARVVAIAIDYYTNILALPPADAATVLRFVNAA
jgi:hypothetical protein